MIRDLMIGGASVENALRLWASSLRDVKQRIRPLFTQGRVAASAGQFLDGLLGNEPRKTGWMRAEAVGDPGPWRQQAILGRGRWDADALRDVAREYALEALCDGDAVLVIDETGFLKQGKASCGVARQYTGSAGKITNCQIGVFATYVSRHGHAFIDRALYLPKEWTEDPDRLEATYVPADTGLRPNQSLRRQWEMSRSLLNYVGPTLPERMLRGPRDVGNGLDRHAIVVSLKGRTQNRQLLMRLQSSEALVGLDHAGRDPSQGHTGISPAFDVARDAANGAHHVLSDVGTGERSTKLLRQLQPDDSQDLVEAFEDAGRYAGPLLVESTREIADQFFSLVGVIELPGLA